MFNLRLFAIGIAVLFIFAEGVAVAGGGSGERIPNYIEITADGELVIEALQGWQNPDGCLHPKRIVVVSDNVFLDRYYAAALTAFSGGEAIWAYLSGCRIMPWGEQYPIAKNLAIRVR